MKSIVIAFVTLLIFNNNICAENNNVIQQNKIQYFAELFFGTQVSGIRKEDYVASNYAPYIQIGIGKWLSSYLAISFNYQGPYFRFIGDDYKHKYFYIDGESILNLHNLFSSNMNRIWSAHAVVGLGYFQNYYLDKSNICLTIGLSNDFKVSNTFSLKFKVSGIAGFKIYQHDKDILMSLSIGLCKKF
jgi:hypothetical protein